MTSILSKPLNANSALQSQTFWLWVIVLVGASLRLYGLGHQSLWLDEGIQYYVSTRNSLDKLFFQRGSFHPPLSFMINHVFLLIEESDFLLRLPSALFGIASLPVMYILARDLTSPRDAVFAVLVLAVSPFHIWYSQEGRMYAQLLFFSLLSSVLILQAVRRGQVRWWILYTVVAAAGMYTHVFMALALGAQFFWVLLCHRRHLVWITASGLAAALLFLPWVVYLPWVSGFASSVGSEGLAGGTTRVGRAGFTWAAMPYTFFVYSAGFSLGPTVAELHENKSLAFVLSFLPSIILIATVFGTLVCLGMVTMYKRWGLQSIAFSLLGLCIPIAGAVVYSSTTKWATFNVRYTVIAFPYFCIFVGMALSYLTFANRLLGRTAILAVLGISGVSIFSHFANPRYAKEDVRSAVAFWRETGKSEFLLAIRSFYPAHRYLADTETERLFIVGGEGSQLVSSIQKVLSREAVSAAYILLARDWNDEREKAIKNAFHTDREKSYPGVKVLRITKTYRQEKLEISDSSRDLHAP